MKRVLVINQSHTTNLGDIAIGRCLETWVRHNGWEPITLPFWDEKSVFGKISHSRISSVIKTFSLPADYYVGKWVKSIITPILSREKIDCAVIGGGELFGSNRGFGAVFSCWIRELEKRGVPCCVVGVSGDRNVSRFQIPRNKKALQKCFLVNVRDEESRNVFSELYGISADYSPDVVFLLGRKNEVGANQTTTLCIPVHLQNKFLNGETDTEYYYHLIQGNSRKDGDQVVFSTTESKDQNYVQDLCFAINQKYGTEYTFIPCSNYEKYCEILERTRIVISGRMHAMILGLLYGCEIKPIAFKSKLEVFEKEYGNNADINHICENVRCSYKKIAETIEKQCS